MPCTAAAPTPTTTPIPQPTPTYKPEPTIRPTVVITSIIDDPTPVQHAAENVIQVHGAGLGPASGRLQRGQNTGELLPTQAMTTTMVSVPPTPSKSQHELNPPSEKQSGHILLTPTRWVPEQMRNLIPATRNAIQAIIVSPRQRTTLVAVLAVAMVAAAGVFIYLIRRRNTVP